MIYIVHSVENGIERETVFDYDTFVAGRDLEMPGIISMLGRAEGDLIPGSVIFAPGVWTKLEVQDDAL